MTTASAKLVHYKMAFPPKVVGEPLMSKLLKSCRVTPNILRGRITDKGAWLEVTLEGSPKSITKALKYLEDKGVTITPVKEG